METISTLIASRPNKLSCPSFKTIYSAILCIGAFSSLLLLRYSPLVLWFAANAIIFLVYRLSMSHHPNPNHSDQQTDDMVCPMLASLPSERWHGHYASPPAEPEPVEKEVMCVDTVREEDKKVVKYKTLDDTWRTIMMQCSTAVERKPLLKKSNSWERSKRRPRRADQARVKPELNKSATYMNGREEQTAHDRQVAEPRTGDTGWRTRDVLVVAHDDLFMRIENFIKKQHDNLRLQRQEEYRRFIESF